MTLIEFEVILVFIAVMYFVGIYLLWYLFMGAIPLALDGLRFILLELVALIRPPPIGGERSIGSSDPSPSPSGGEEGIGRDPLPTRRSVKS